LENAVLNLPEGQEKMVWLIDFTGWTMANAVPIKTARETTNILQNHYPERLAVAFLFNPPKVFEAFWKVKALSLSPMLCMSIFTNIVCLTKYIQVHSKKIFTTIQNKKYGVEIEKNGAVFFCNLNVANSFRLSGISSTQHRSRR